MERRAGEPAWNGNSLRTIFFGGGTPSLMQPATVGIIERQEVAKGDVFTVAQVAGILAAKATASLIPMCHPLLLTDVTVNLQTRPDGVSIRASVTTFGRTGAEMEALTAVSVAGLTIYDMCKAVDKTMVLGEIRLVHKQGGKSDDDLMT